MSLHFQNIKVIAFDADDTLWDNEPFFVEAEEKFTALLEDFLPRHTITRELLQTEIQNMELYGYGVKAFMLSMIETAIRISEQKIPASVIENIIHIGRSMLEKPVQLLDGVENVLLQMKSDYRLVLATKGDLLDQERKLKKSNLEGFFHHIEIMSEKKEADYRKLIRHLDIAPENFLMIGNSLKSDIMPVIHCGGNAVHVPYHTLWALEKLDIDLNTDHFTTIEKISELPALLKK